MPDWGEWADKGINVIDSGIDTAKEKVGEGVDWATDKVGDGLDKVGAHDWADSVEDWGDETASSLGAEVGEQQLGQTEEANELIHGNPGKIAATVKNLRDFQKAFDLVGGGMKKLDSSHWKGEAASTFREKFQTLPTDWLHAADAFEDAAKALETYSKAVTSAQGKAKEAIALYKEGNESSKTAADTYNKKVDAYNAARNSDNPPARPEPFSDPGVAKRERAHEILKEARRHRNESADTAKSAVTAAMAHAPKEPTGREKLLLEVADYGMGQGVELAHFGGGIVKGTAGLVNFVRSVNPTDPYNITHPAEYWKGLNTTLAGLASTAANPDRALKNAWDAAKGDPAEFLGRLVPELVGTKGAGGLKALVRTGAKDLADTPPGKGRAGHDKDPDGNGNQCSKVKCEGDPVDVATGRMLLPQTDIALPGSLPWCSGAPSTPPTAQAAGSARRGRAQQTNDWRSTPRVWCSFATRGACWRIHIPRPASLSCRRTAVGGLWSESPTATRSPIPRPDGCGTSSTTWRRPPSSPRSMTATAGGSASNTTRSAPRRRSSTTAATT